MAIQSNGGTFETILRMRDEATAVLSGFAEKAKQTFTTSGKAAEDSGKKTEESAEKSTVAVGKIGVALGAAATAAAAFGIAMLKSGIAAADKADETAKKVGVTTEFLTGMEWAAKLAGVSSDQLTKALGNMNNNLSKAADNAGPAKKALAELGLDAEKLANMGGEAAVLAIADALERVPSAMDRGRFATDIFGKAAGDMAQVLEGGSKNVRALLTEAQELGIVIQSGPASAAGQFNDSLDRLAANFRGITVRVTNELVPAFVPLIDSFQRTLKASGLLDAVATGLIATLKAIALAVQVAGDGFGILGRLVGGAAAVIGAVVKGEFKEAWRIGKEIGADLDALMEKSGENYRRLLGIKELQAKPQGQFRKQSFGGEDGGGGMMRTAFGDRSDNPPGFWSDITPGAEVVTAKGKEAEDALDVHQNRVEEKTREHHIRLRNYDRDARSVRFTIGQQYDKMSLESASFFFGQLGGLMQTKSRALFEIGKAGAVAETIIQTYRAAQGAYAALASIPVIGPGLGAAAAAAAIAVGFARVQAIRSTSFGSASGSPVLSSGGTTGPVTSAGAGTVPYTAPNQGVLQQTREVNINLSGQDVFSAAAIRDSLIPAINDAIGDGAVIRVQTV